MFGRRDWSVAATSVLGIECEHALDRPNPADGMNLGHRLGSAPDHAERARSGNRQDVGGDGRSRAGAQRGEERCLTKGEQRPVDVSCNEVVANTLGMSAQPGWSGGSRPS